MQRTTVNGIAATYVVGRANTSSGAVDVGVFAYQWDQDTIYHFVTLTRAGQGLAPFASMVNSLRRISAGGSGGDPAEGDRCGDGGEGRYDPVAWQAAWRTGIFRWIVSWR